MKKFLALLLALVLMFSFCACDKSNDETGTEAPEGLVSVWVISRIDDMSGAYTFAFTYDDDHNLDKITYTKELPDSSLVDSERQFQFDEQGRILSDGHLADGVTKFTCYSYDIYGNKIKEGMTYTYNEQGKILSATDNRTKETTTYTYNDSGRVTQALGTLEEISYAYDAAGRLIEEKSSTGWKAVYTYDEVGKLVKLESGYEGEAAWVETYTYDDNGNIIKVTSQSEEYNGGKPIAYEIEYKQIFVTESRAKALNAQKDYVFSKLMTLTW